MCQHTEQKHCEHREHKPVREVTTRPEWPKDSLGACVFAGGPWYDLEVSRSVVYVVKQYVRRGTSPMNVDRGETLRRTVVQIGQPGAGVVSALNYCSNLFRVWRLAGET